MGRLTAVAVAVVTIAAAAVAAILLTRSSTPAAPRAATPAAAPSVRVAQTKLGRILVNGQGRTLYLYTKDRGTKSACSRRCMQVWPPATVSGAPVAGPGVAAAKLDDDEGRRPRPPDLVYNGHPLYTLSADVRPGQINGEGFLGTWFVISAEGKRIGKLSHSSSEY